MTTIWKPARESTGPLCYRAPDLDLLWLSSSVFSTQCMAGDGDVLSCPTLTLAVLFFTSLFSTQPHFPNITNHESSVQSNGHLGKQETTACQAWTEQFSLLSPAHCDTKSLWRSQGPWHPWVHNPYTISPYTGQHLFSSAPLPELAKVKLVSPSLRGRERGQLIQNTGC